MNGYCISFRASEDSPHPDPVRPAREGRSRGASNAELRSWAKVALIEPPNVGVRRSRASREPQGNEGHQETGPHEYQSRGLKPIQHDATSPKSAVKVPCAIMPSCKSVSSKTERAEELLLLQWSRCRLVLATAGCT